MTADNTRVPIGVQSLVLPASGTVYSGVDEDTPEYGTAGCTGRFPGITDDVRASMLCSG